MPESPKRLLQLWASRQLTAAGYKKQGQQSWIRQTDDLIVIVELDKSPHSAQYALDVGLSIVDDEKVLPKKANFCQVYVRMEKLPVAVTLENTVDSRFTDFRSFTLMAFDFDDGKIPVKVRQEMVEIAVQHMVDYLDSIRSGNSLIERVREGEFAKGFVHKDLKRTL